MFIYQHTRGIKTGRGKDIRNLSTEEGLLDYPAQKKKKNNQDFTQKSILEEDCFWTDMWKK